MTCLKHISVVGALLIATSMLGCGDNSDSPTEDTESGSLTIAIPASPGDVTSIHVTVTAADFLIPVEADLVLQAGVWTGTVIDVPPGPARTVTAEGYDVDLNNTFEGIATNVTVFAGKLTGIQLILKPKVDGPFPVANTPPNFINVIHPPQTLSTEPVTFFAIADDPDANTQLTYVWSVLSGGGSFSSTTQPGQTPGIPVSTIYTPMSGFTGFAVIQVAVTDGLATTLTTFPLAIGAGVAPQIAFDTLPDLVVSSISRQLLSPNGTTQIQYTLTNPNQTWTPATMNIHTAWSDSCGGSFDTAPEDISINKNDTAARTVNYTAPASGVLSPEVCTLTLTILDVGGVQMTFTANVWVNPPMVMFVSSANVTGGTFGGQWQNADDFCQNLADSLTAVVPTGTYQALLSFDEINAIDRLIDAPYIRVDGTQIARNKAELYSINLLNAVRTDEHNAFNGASLVYTGTTGVGVKGENCLNWTDATVGQTATVGGSTTSTNPGWTATTTQTCDTQLPVYCVQQPSVLLP
jgi:hypothetical protein